MTEQVNMADFIAARSDQLNADDLMSNPKTITITKVTASPDSAEQPVSIHYAGGEGRPFKPCKTVRRIMVGVWGADASKYVGRSMTLYRDPTVSFGGMQVGGIRVSHMSHIDGDKTVALLVTRGRKAPFKVKPLATGAHPSDERATALKALTDAAEEGLDALANVWKQKWLAPHRDALQADLDRLKATAAAKQPTPEASNSAANATTEQPEAPSQAAEAPSSVQLDDPLQQWLDKIGTAPTEDEVSKLDRDSELDRNFFDQAQNDRLDEALATRREQLRAEAVDA